MRESIDKIQADLAERIQQQSEELEAQIKLQQQQFEKQIVDNQVQLNQITSMLSQQLKEKETNGASSSNTISSTEQGQNLNPGTNTLIYTIPIQPTQIPNPRIIPQGVNSSNQPVTPNFSNELTHDEHKPH